MDLNQLGRLPDSGGNNFKIGVGIGKKATCSNQNRLHFEMIGAENMQNLTAASAYAKRRAVFGVVVVILVIIARKCSFIAFIIHTFHLIAAGKQRQQQHVTR